MASAYSTQSYSSLVATGSDSDFISTRAAAGFLLSRPTVAIVLAVMRPWLSPTTAEAAPAFQALLQALSAFGVLFVFRNVFGASKPIGFLVASAFATGFFPQYISDINAWSSLSSLSFAPVAVALTYLVAAKEGGLACAGPLAIVLAGILYYYPESSVTCAISCSVVALGAMALSQDRIKSSGLLTFAVCAALIVCLPAWQVTVGVLFAQAAFSHSIPWLWFVASDSFYFADLGPDGAWSAYRFFSTPIDVIAGLLGIYFIRPPATLGTLPKIFWKLLEAAFFVTLAITILRSIKAKPSTILVPGCVASLALPLMLLVRGDYWTAGKAVTMAAPIFFAVLAFPLTQHQRLLAIPAAILLMLHIGFGFQRVIAAADETGIRAATGGYPHHDYLKAQYDWTVPRWRSELIGCRHVAVDITDQHLERLVETVLNDLSTPSDFRTERDSNYGFGTIIPATTNLNATDCSISDKWMPAAKTKLIYLSTGDHRELLRRSVVTGLYGIEAWRDGILRWTDGNAQWTISSEERIAALNISLWTDVIPPGTSVQILVNGREISRQPVWNGVKRFPVNENGPLDQNAPLTIAIKSSTFSVPNDPRNLGLALRSVTVEDLN